LKTNFVSSNVAMQFVPTRKLIVHRVMLVPKIAEPLKN